MKSWLDYRHFALAAMVASASVWAQSVPGPTSVDTITGMGDLLKYGELGLFLADLLLVAWLIHLVIARGPELSPATVHVVERILYVLVGATVLVVLLSFAKSMIGSRIHAISISLAPENVDKHLLPGIKRNGNRLVINENLSTFDKVDAAATFLIDLSLMETNRTENLKSLNRMKQDQMQKSAPKGQAGVQDDPL